MSKFELPEEPRAILQALITERESLGMTDQAFARKYLGCDASKWSRIIAAIKPDAAESYFDMVQNRESVYLEMELWLREIRRERELAARFSGEKIHAVPEFRQVAQALRECRQKMSPERLVVFLAETGGGKSFLCEYIRCEMGAHVVETREAWKRSYSTALQDICRGCRIRLGNETVPSRMEDKLIEGLSNRRAVLALDEGEFFGTAALNGIKLLLNKSQVSILICAIPAAYDRWNQYFPTESKQLARRTHAIIESSITEGAVQAFFAGYTLESKDCLKAVAKAANTFGSYSLMRRVKDLLEDTEVTAEAMGKAITKAQRQMRRS